MSDYVMANFGSLSDGQAQFTTAYNGLTSTVENLQGQLQGQLGDWVGAAQQAYHEAQTTWNQAMADMGAVITGMSGVIGAANTNYQEAERVNSQMF